MEKELREIFRYNIQYTQFDCGKMLYKIYNLFKNNILYDPENSEQFRYLGTYFNFVINDYNKDIQYYLIAIDKGNDNAME